MAALVVAWAILAVCLVLLLCGLAKYVTDAAHQIDAKDDINAETLGKLALVSGACAGITLALWLILVRATHLAWRIL